MHRSRADRKANQARRALAAHKQRAVPAGVQAEIAAANANRRAELNVARGYGDPHFTHPPYRRKSRRGAVLDKLGELLSLGDFLAILHSFRKAG